MKTARKEQNRSNKPTKEQHMSEHLYSAQLFEYQTKAFYRYTPADHKVVTILSVSIDDSPFYKAERVPPQLIEQLEKEITLQLRAASCLNTYNKWREAQMLEAT